MRIILTFSNACVESDGTSNSESDDKPTVKEK
jgi:hypothetical protein